MKYRLISDGRVEEIVRACFREDLLSNVYPLMKSEDNVSDAGQDE